eukprot:7715517-Pyramimonas_sp.AAC.1
MDTRQRRARTGRRREVIQVVFLQRMAYLMTVLMDLYMVAISCSSPPRGAQPRCAFCGWSAGGAKHVTANQHS